MWSWFGYGETEKEIVSEPDSPVLEALETVSVDTIPEANISELTVVETIWASLGYAVEPPEEERIAKEEKEKEKPKTKKKKHPKDSKQSTAAPDTGEPKEKKKKKKSSSETEVLKSEEQAEKKKKTKKPKEIDRTNASALHATDVPKAVASAHIATKIEEFPPSAALSEAERGLEQKKKEKHVKPKKLKKLRDVEGAKIDEESSKEAHAIKETTKPKSEGEETTKKKKSKREKGEKSKDQTEPKVDKKLEADSKLRKPSTDVNGSMGDERIEEFQQQHTRLLGSVSSAGTAGVERLPIVSAISSVAFSDVEANADTLVTGQKKSFTQQRLSTSSKPQMGYSAQAKHKSAELSSLPPASTGLGLTATAAKPKAPQVAISKAAGGAPSASPILASVKALGPSRSSKLKQDREELSSTLGSKFYAESGASKAGRKTVIPNFVLTQEELLEAEISQNMPKHFLFRDNAFDCQVEIYKLKAHINELTTALKESKEIVPENYFSYEAIEDEVIAKCVPYLQEALHLGAGVLQIDRFYESFLRKVFLKMYTTATARRIKDVALKAYEKHKEIVPLIKETTTCNRCMVSSLIALVHVLVKIIRRTCRKLFVWFYKVSAEARIATCA